MSAFRAPIFILFLVLFSSFGANAQSDSIVAKKDSVDYYEMSLEQLLKLKAHGVPTELEKLINSLISVASKKPLNTRESPSIVSLITEDEIKKSGARDLIDVLRQIPGFDFGVDVEGVVGIGIRGLWGHEGKILLLIDGQEMNETLFATTQFGNHYPIDQIKKIEVIRGPGSAIYGGYAEYGVINIITQQGEDINGISATAAYGQGATDFLRRRASVSIGQKINDLEYSVSGMFSQGQRSDRDYIDFNDSSYNMGGGNSRQDNNFINAGIRYKGFSFRGIGDFYHTTLRDGYGDVIPGGPVVDKFNSLFTELKYVLKVNDKLTITPKLSYKSHTPWQSDEYSGKDAYDRIATRALGNVTASYNFNRYINFVVGAEAYQDAATDRVDSSYFSNDEQKVSYNNYSLFTQGLIKTRLVNFIIGLRYDNHSAYGISRAIIPINDFYEVPLPFVPRVGLTKKYGRFHFKALYSCAFRAPSIENINYATVDGIKPELTQVSELELGYQITRKSILTVNLYNINTSDPIVYYTDSTLADLYINSGQSGTQGFEAEYKIRQKWGYVAVNYAFYSAGGKEKIEDYQVRASGSSLVGFANHKFNLNGSVNITKDLSINPTVSYIGKRWGYGSINDDGFSVIEEFDPVLLINLFINYQTPLNGLTVGVGAYDILNQQYSFLQPYNGYHAPLPGPAREFMLKLNYNFNFKKKGEN